MAIDYTTPLGQVRLNITDLDESAFLLSDEMLEGLLASSDGSVNRATAGALTVIATSPVLIRQKIRTQDLSTDGPAGAEALRRQAAMHRGLAATESGETAFISYVGSGRGRLEAAETPLW